MKKLYKDIRKISFFLMLISIFNCSVVLGETTPEARVDYVMGRAFLRTSDGQTRELRKGDHIYHLSEINTEEGSLIGVSNFHDQQFSLAGSGYIKFFHNILELRAGYLWIESISSKNTEYSVQTPNAKVTYEKGKSILSYDQYGEKTQILTTQGRFDFMNIFENHLSISVSTGEFSFISKDYEDGMPRRPTPAGKSTFMKITGLFKGKPQSQRYTGKDSSYTLVNQKRSVFGARAPSSGAQKNKGQIIYAHSKKLKYGTKEQKLMDIYNRGLSSLRKIQSDANKAKKKFFPDYKKKSKVAVRVFGARKSYSKKSTAPSKKLLNMFKSTKKHKMKKRMPASVSDLNGEVKIKESSFESSLIKEYKKQLRHTDEVNHLIQDLKSYDQDYKQAY